MNIERYITVQAVQTKDNELIPIWDNRVRFKKTEMYGNVITIEDKTCSYNNRQHQQIVECIYDLKTMTLSPGIELEHFPENTTPEIGEECYYEVPYHISNTHNAFKEVKIKDIIFENFTMQINKGKKIDEYWKKYFHSKGIVIENDKLYCIKQFEPTWILEDGTKIEYSHKLRTKYK